MTAYDGVSADHPGDAQALAAAAAEEMARRYPPARTTLALVKTNSTFGQDLESALRDRGFPVGAGNSSGLRIAYTLDVIRDDPPSTCYLRVQTSDGGVFGSVRPLTGEVRRVQGGVVAPETPPLSAASSPQSHPLPDTPPAPAAASTPAPLPSPAPQTVMPAMLERRAVHTPTKQHAEASPHGKSPVQDVAPPSAPPQGPAPMTMSPPQAPQPANAPSQPTSGRKLVGMGKAANCDASVEGKTFLDGRYVCRKGKLEILKGAKHAQ